MKYLTDAVNGKNYNAQVGHTGTVYIYCDHRSIAIKDSDMADIVSDWEKKHECSTADAE